MYSSRFLFTNNTILYVENSKVSTKTKQKALLEQINEFSDVAGYKINTQISAVFQYTNNEQSKRKLTIIYIDIPSK